MQTYKIGYNTKLTNSNNTYVEIAKEDELLLLQTIISIITYMNELSLSDDTDIKNFIKWYNTGNKKYPYNKRLGKRNTPNSMLSGIINNMMFGKQYNLSLEQLPFYEEIITNCVTIIQEIKTSKNIDLQANNSMMIVKFGIHFG